MTDRFNCTQLVITGTSFVSALAVGYLFISRRSRSTDRWVTDHATEIADWVDHKGRETFAKSVKQMQQLRGSLRLDFNHYVPDLYKATEHIGLSESELSRA